VKLENKLCFGDFGFTVFGFIKSFSCTHISHNF
jgi:hypothetical protein